MMNQLYKPGQGQRQRRLPGSGNSRGWKQPGVLIPILVLLLVLAAGCSQDGAPEAAGPNAESGEATTGSEEDAGDVVQTGSKPVVPPTEDELIAQGEKIYQETAGGIGCKACHGLGAQGDIGPNILGKSAETIQTQLDTNQAMQFIILSSQEVEAVAAYLKWLQEHQ